ncbi:aquaporin-11-like [Littorina saxatilis]|uniref:Aquaporin n=1 Tax=Littorina saxatilis TaxID=31220 RepID=A0AAN9GL79_9CAEN
MDWREAWVMTMGVEPEGPYVPPYVASLIFFFINMVVGVGLRGLTRLLVSRSVRGHVLDFLCTMEACAYFFENNFVVKYYGYTWLAVAIIAQLYVCARTFGDNIDNPVKAFHGWLIGQISLLQALIKIVVTALAGLASYRLARLIWSLDLIEDHHERFYEVTCGSDLQVTLVTGLVIEMAACLSDLWLGLQTLSSMTVLDEFVKYLNAALMIVFGLQTTGMYFNPAMATGHTLGCGGTQYWEHFAVYWIGPFLGCFLATFLDRLLHIDVVSKSPAQPPPPPPPSSSSKKKKKKE